MEHNYKPLPTSEDFQNAQPGLNQKSQRVKLNNQVFKPAKHLLITMKRKSWYDFCQILLFIILLTLFASFLYSVNTGKLDGIIQAFSSTNITNHYDFDPITNNQIDLNVDDRDDNEFNNEFYFEFTEEFLDKMEEVLC